MFKLNNKGMTTVEILVSFILVAVISATLYTTVSNFNRKLQRESDKLTISTFKNTFTKNVQDDLIKNGLINVQTKEKHSSNAEKPRDVYIVDFELKDHSRKRLVVVRQLADYYNAIKNSSGAITEKITVDDEFHIYYGIPANPFDTINVANANAETDSIKGLEEFNIPDFGFGYNDQICSGSSTRCKVKDFRLINVKITNQSKVLSVFLGFQHIDEGTKYAINIVCPVDYQTY